MKLSNISLSDRDTQKMDGRAVLPERGHFMGGRRWEGVWREMVTQEVEGNIDPLSFQEDQLRYSSHSRSRSPLCHEHLGKSLAQSGSSQKCFPNQEGPEELL